MPMQQPPTPRYAKNKALYAAPGLENSKKSTYLHPNYTHRVPSNLPLH